MSPSSLQNFASNSTPKSDPPDVQPNTIRSGFVVAKSLAAGRACCSIILISASRVVSTRYMRSVWIVYRSFGNAQCRSFSIVVLDDGTRSAIRLRFVVMIPLPYKDLLSLRYYDHSPFGHGGV